MKFQIIKFDPHQNAKVLAFMMAVISLIFLFPMMLIMFAAMPEETGFPRSMGILTVFLIPIMYLIITYIGAAIGICIFNFVVKYTGGLEFETKEENA